VLFPGKFGTLIFGCLKMALFLGLFLPLKIGLIFGLKKLKKRAPKKNLKIK
jgi:hypothetical protein